MLIAWISDSKNLKKASMSEAMMSYLSNRCPELEFLHLSHVYLNVSAKSLPKNISILKLTNSWIPHAKWFSDFEDPIFFSNLIHLDLSFSTTTKDADLKSISAKKGLKSLSLNGNYRITPKGLLSIVESLINLEKLEIGSSEVNDLVFHKMSRSLTSLRHLDVNHCKCMTVGCINSIGSMKTIKVLILTGIYGVNTEKAKEILQHIIPQYDVFQSPTD